MLKQNDLLWYQMKRNDLILYQMIHDRIPWLNKGIRPWSRFKMDEQEQQSAKSSTWMCDFEVYACIVWIEFNIKNMLLTYCYGHSRWLGMSPNVLTTSICEREAMCLITRRHYLLAFATWGSTLFFYFMMMMTLGIIASWWASLILHIGLSSRNTIIATFRWVCIWIMILTLHSLKDHDIASPVGLLFKK